MRANSDDFATIELIYALSPSKTVITEIEHRHAHCSNMFLTLRSDMKKHITRLNKLVLQSVSFGNIFNILEIS